MTNKKEDNLTRYNLTKFIIFVVLSLFLYHFDNILILDLPLIEILNSILKPIEVFFHESGHLMSTLFFGGQVVELHLELNSGHVKSLVGEGAAIIVFLGYPTASLMGLLIYSSSIYISNFLKLFLISYTSFFFIFIDGFTTFLILSMIMAIFIISWKLKIVGSYLLRFIGVYIMISSIYSPTYLITYQEQGDHVLMAKQTGLPATLFIFIWFCIGIACLYKALKISIKKKESSKKRKLCSN